MLNLFNQIELIIFNNVLIGNISSESLNVNDDK